MGLVFERLTGDDDRAYVPSSQSAVDQLESITAAEKAQAVPYVRIWQVDARTGRPVNADPSDPSVPLAPLNMRLAAPPRFGSSAGTTMRERPPVSLERVAVKTQTPKGIITYQQLQLEFVVHRPDVIFDAPEPGVDSWSTVITPGLVHCLEYGWSASSGVRNGILNGEGFSDLELSPATVVPGRKRLRFVVVNYSFRVVPSGEVQVSVEAFEEGEFNLRQAILGGHEVEELSRETKQVFTDLAGGVATVPKYDPQELYTEAGRRVVRALQERVRDLRRTKAPGNDELVRFGDLANVVLAPTIERALNDIGFTRVRLVMGDFNRRVGRPQSRYRLEHGPDGAHIGDFQLPMRDVEQVFNDTVRLGTQITLYNLINRFLEVFQRPDTWDRRDAPTDEGGMHMSKLPHVVVRTQLNPATSTAVLYVVDIEREFTRLTDSERKFTPAASRAEVREYLRGKRVPIVSFNRGNSYVQDASFEVVTDDKIKGILMRRYLAPARAGTVDADVKRKVGTAVDPRELMYSSSITGDLTMLGNFVFDTFSLVWLDFGVSRWDGPFLVREREDIIDRSGFTTKVSLVAEGSDPLGTQGRLSDVRRRQAEREDAAAARGRKPNTP